MTAGLHVARGLDLPLDAVTETLAILAKRGAGKSNAAVVMAEEMYDHGLPWVAIDPKGDWWGIRAAGDGKAPGLAVLVFGGLHGDVALEPTAGHLVADLVVDQRLTCVLDVSEMTKADQRRFLVDFAERLYRRNTEPLHVFCEEADEYIPQLVRGDAARMVGAFETLVKRGRTRGLGVTLITQRSASLNKDVLTQIETLIPMRTPSPQDRKAILAWVDLHDAGRDAVDALPGLASGEAFVFSPQWLGILKRITFRRRRTFDSGATPKVGGKPRPPATLAEVDLAAIKEAMAETIERAKADDPRELRARIRDLETQLGHARRAAPEVIVQRVEVPVLSDADRTLLRDTATTLSLTVERITSAVTAKPPAPSEPPRPAPRIPAPRPHRAVASEAFPPDAARLRPGARRMVTSLGRMAPLRLTRAQWGTVSRMKTTGGTWRTYLGDIRRRGLIDESPAGYTLTAAGFEFIGGRPEPMTAAELQDHYRQILRPGAVRMLDAIMGVHPAGIDKETIGHLTDMEITGGTFRTYLGDLTRNGLVERDGEYLRATDILMFGAEQ